MAKPINALKDVRLEKLKKLEELGINPYPARSKRKEEIKKALEMMESKVSVAGRIMAIRGHGAIKFFDLEDLSGKIQIVFKRGEYKKELEGILDLLDLGDFICVQGKVFKTKAGETSVLTEDFQVLSKALRPLPSSWHGLKDIEERYRKRYLDLIINKDQRKVFQVRSELISIIRGFLNERGFVEVETPILQSIYGGASARPFKTMHNALKAPFYLRISDELYLKRLIVGGFEKVYEIGKNFRNEGIDKAHNPEFTAIEFYWAYANYEDLMELTEELFEKILKELLGTMKIKNGDQVLDFTLPFPRASFADLLLQETGIDMDKFDDEKELIKEIKKKKIEIDLKGVIGLGNIFDKLYKEKVRPKIIQPTFLLDYPSSMIALAKRKEKNPKRIATFQLLANGIELIKAYNELNDPLDQKKRWQKTEKLLGKGEEEAERLDEDFVEALEYGMPPTAGWGMGIDRLVSFITNTSSLKDVILFPTLRPSRSKAENERAKRDKEIKIEE